MSGPLTVKFLRSGRYVACTKTKLFMNHQCRHFGSITQIVESPYSDVEVSQVPLHQCVWEHVNRWPDKVAIECGITGRKYKYGEARKLSRMVAGSLLGMGLKPGDSVTVVWPNIPEYPIAVLGGMEAGLTMSTINPRYTPDEVSYQIKEADSKCVLVHPENINVVQKAIDNLGQELKMICVEDGPNAPVPRGIQPFSSLFQEHSEGLRQLDRLSYHTDDVCLLPFSSGTTGLPKGVCLTHQSIGTNLLQIEHPEICLVQESTGNHQDLLPAVLPFFHIYGGIVILYQAMRRGAKLITLPKFEPETFLRVMHKKKDVVLYVVPPIVFFLGNSPLVYNEHLDGLRYSVSAAAPCGTSDIEKIQRKKPHTIIQAYGMTEASPILTFPRNTCSNTLTIGPPVSNTVAKVIDWTTGAHLPPGEHGELVFKGPQVMKGYHNKPEATANTIDHENWLHSGDIGYYDKNNHFYIVDRIKELIKVKGFQVPPAELEEVLRTHPEVGDAGVVGIPDPQSGEVPIAFIVPKAGKKPTSSPSQIKTYIAEKVAGYKRLSKVFWVESIPKTASGKILRRQLKELALKRGG